MFDSIGWGEILVLLVAGLFILGPERLPEAAAWLGRAGRQVKGYVSGAQEHLRTELGPEFDELRQPLNELRQPLNELRGLRGMDPRRAVTRSLFQDAPEIRPNGHTPGSAGAVPQRHPAAEPSRQPGERPPIDLDAT